MAISRASLDSISTSLASVSVGTTNDPLSGNLKAISAARIETIELGFPDIVAFAPPHHEREIKEEGLCDPLLRRHGSVRKLCAANKLDIMMLQPLHSSRVA
jgi:hypothetical protein